MMDFLRRLNPANAALASAARPVLAPRFAPVRGIGETEGLRPTAPAEPVIRTAPPEPRDAQEPAQVPMAAERELLPGPLASSEARAAPQRLPDSPTRPKSAEWQAVRATALHEPERRAGFEAPRREVDPESERPAARSTPAPTLRPEAQAAVHRRAPPAAAPGDARHVAAPLSDQALAARVLPPAPPRPLIRVTIDRIDVRAPAAPARPAALRRTAPEPSVSLADYLRPGPSRGGGAS